MSFLTVVEVFLERTQSTFSWSPFVVVYLSSVVVRTSVVSVRR